MRYISAGTTSRVALPAFTECRYLPNKNRERGRKYAWEVTMTGWMMRNTRRAGARRATAAIASLAGTCLAAIGLAGAPATAQTYGLATMQPGTLAHTTGTAIAKVLKDKGGLNTLVQTTAGETVLIPMVARGEIDLGIANLAEVQAQAEGSGPNRQADLRLIGVIHPLWASFFVRKDTTMKANADMKDPALLYKKFDMPYHPGALKYFADNKMQPVEIK
jgi:NMT1-like family